MEFNKTLFASYLQQAKGNRSINKFGSDTDVDPGYISRLLRELVDSPPSAEIIKKLASKAYSDITIDKLLIAAGYLPNDKNDTDLKIAESSEIFSVNSKLDPEIISLARARQKMTPEQYEKWMRISKEIFPEAFKDDNNN